MCSLPRLYVAHTKNTPFRTQGNIQEQQVLWKSTRPERFLLNCTVCCTEDPAVSGTRRGWARGWGGNANLGWKVLAGLESLTAAGGGRWPHASVSPRHRLRVE